MSEQQDKLFDFPCSFPVKVMGARCDDFHPTVVEIVRRHAPDTPDEAFVLRESSNGNFQSITATIIAHSRDQLDALYRDLTACELVNMAL
ncbi:MAG: DUF493 domain-containing protein [Gammaproteobacteria bacterium]|nr:MAG: DUF493 domain-containing protein [Gammaproteobacteria bacterium]